MEMDYQRPAVSLPDSVCQCTRGCLPRHHSCCTQEAYGS
jgi:hypothetical protein